MKTLGSDKINLVKKCIISIGLSLPNSKFEANSDNIAIDERSQLINRMRHFQGFKSIGNFIVRRRKGTTASLGYML